MQGGLKVHGLYNYISRWSGLKLIILKSFNHFKLYIIIWLFNTCCKFYICRNSVNSIKIDSRYPPKNGN